MARAKGSNMVHMRSWVLSARDADAWDRVLAALPETDRHVVRSLDAVGWYDLAMQHRLLRCIDETLGDGDLGLVPIIGRFEAEQDLTKIQRLLLGFANPAYVLEKAGEYWRRFYDSGRWRVERLGDGAARGRLRNLAVIDESFCLYLDAYIQRMFELVGAEKVTMAHPLCRNRGDDECVFEGSWLERRSILGRRRRSERPPSGPR